MRRVICSSTRIISRSACRPALRCNRPRVTCGLPQRWKPTRWDEGSRRPFTSLSVKKQDIVSPERGIDHSHAILSEGVAAPEKRDKLPLQCPGCGAPSQTIDPEAAGYYGSQRAAKATHRSAAMQEEDAIFQNALKSGALSTDEPTVQSVHTQVEQAPSSPICERCHYLLHQSRGTSIVHPSMHSIRSIIDSSPHKHNHIYHILDAADFPLSLIPNLQHTLDLPRLRTQNRRSKSTHYSHNRTADVSFIITRSDLLAPKKEQVDALVPYLREVLREALGKSGKNVRLGNVRCVSAKRGWWTRTVKEEIWERGGAGWMVGRVNVGKSALFEVVFPKGRNREVDVDVGRMRREEMLEMDVARLSEREGKPKELRREMDFASSPGELSEASDAIGVIATDTSDVREVGVESNIDPFDQIQEDTYFDESDTASLLPPAQPETPYPQMPLISSLPGTTASPIRIPFGNGKGELIDLPGIDRSSLSTHIEPGHHKDLVMKSRVTPEQYTIKPGQSLLLGGVIRVTPKTDELIFLAYPFLPLKPHVTSNAKAIAIQTGVQEDGEPYSGTVETIATEASKQSISSAGTFKLEWDVTKARTGPLTSKAAGKLKPTNLPFKIYSADILIESVGWVELVCQVRRRSNRPRSFITESVSDAFGEVEVKREADDDGVPEVEVWSPEGKFVGCRRPMGAAVLNFVGKPKVGERRGRGRQNIGMAKRREGGRRAAVDAN